MRASRRLADVANRMKRKGARETPQVWRLGRKAASAAERGNKPRAAQGGPSHPKHAARVNGGAADPREAADGRRAQTPQLLEGELPRGGSENRRERLENETTKPPAGVQLKGARQLHDRLANFSYAWGLRGWSEGPVSPLLLASSPRYLPYWGCPKYP